MSKSIKTQLGRLIVAAIAAPAAVGLTGVLVSCLKDFSISYIPFFLGVLAYTLGYPVFKKPFYAYVVGHELTHVLGVWLARGRVHDMRVGEHGGMVKTDTANVWVSLLPYLFPIYTALLLFIYMILSIVWDMSKFHSIMVFLVGATWAFHLWMTLYVVRHNQPDIEQSGVIFSAVIIYLANLLVLGTLLVIISPELTFKDFLVDAVVRVKDVYVNVINCLTKPA
jgi:hypothetical protein